MSLDPLSELTDPNRAALNNPRVRSFLDKISQSEGADYDTLVGGKKIKDLSRHPNVVGLTTSAGPSTAFGRYQITHSTHKSKLAKYADLDYSPENQDVRAVELLRQTKALAALEQGDEQTAIKRAGKEWASLPGSTLPGRKNYAAFKEQDPLTELTKPQQGSVEQPELDPLTALTQPQSAQPQGRGAPAQPVPVIHRRQVQPSTSSIPGMGAMKSFRRQQAQPSGQGSSNVGELRRLDEIELARRKRVEGDVQREQTPDEQALRMAPGAASARLLDPKLTQDEEVLRRIKDETDQEAEFTRLEKRRPEIDALKTKFREFAGTGHGGRMVQSLQSALAGTGVQAGNLISTLTAGRRGQGLTDEMRLAQVALAELEREDPNRGWIAAGERALPGASFELAKMYMLSRVPVAGRATLPGLGALSEADKGVGPAIRGAAEGEAFHRGFGAMENLPKTARFAVGTAVPASIAIAQGQDPKTAILSNTAFGAMALAGPRARGAENRGGQNAQIETQPNVETQPEGAKLKQSLPLQVASNRIGILDPQSLSDAVGSQAFQEKGFRGLPVESQRLVMSGVLSAIHDPQIRESVVKFIPVDVVNNLVRAQSPSDVLLHDKDVLLNPSPVAQTNRTISLPVDTADTLARVVADLVTKQTAVGVQPTTRPLEQRPAVATRNVDPLFSNTNLLSASGRAEEPRPVSQRPPVSSESGSTVETINKHPEIIPENPRSRHALLQPRRQRGEGKGQFKSETRAQREQRLVEVAASTPNRRVGERRNTERRIGGGRATDESTAPASEDVVKSAQSPSGPETHATVRRVLSSEFKDRILKDIGADAVPLNPTELGGIKASSVSFEKPDGSIVTVEDAAFSDSKPTYGNKRDGFVVTKTPATRSVERRQLERRTGERRTEQPAGVSVPEGKAIRSSADVKSAMQKHFNLPEDQADAVSRIADARAETWAKQTGKPKEEWYRTRIADITGGKPGEGALYQKAPDTPEFNRWFGDSKAVNDKGEPLVVYSGHSNPELYGDAYDPKKGTAGGFYASESPEIASNYATGKFGAKEYYENGDQYRFPLKNGKFNKKLWQMELSPEQQAKVREFMADENLGGGSFDIEAYWKDNARYDKDASRALARGGLRDLHSIWKFLESMGENIAYPKEGDAPYFQRQQKGTFENLLDYLDIPWKSHEWNQPAVLPIYLRIRNPLDADKPFPSDVLAALKQAAKGERTAANSSNAQWTKDYPLKEWIKSIEEGKEYWSTQIPKKALPILKRFGYDGIKERGIKGSGAPRDQRQINWIVFDPEQIKSATGNRGTFDPNDPNILHQDKKASVEFLDDNRAIIRGLQKPDVSSTAHELAHVFRRDLEGGLLKDAEQWAGVQDSKWEMVHEEKFARGFERYLREGKAPTEQLRVVFQQFKDWLTNIYRSIKGSPIEGKLSPEIRSVFDQLLGKDASPQPETNPASTKIETAPVVTSGAEQVKPPEPLKPVQAGDAGQAELKGTFAKTEMMQADREALGLDQIPRPVKQTDLEILEKAKVANAKDASEPARIADKVLKADHRLSSQETMQIVLRAAEIKKQRSQIMRELSDATDSNAIKSKGADADALKNEYDRLSAATETSGTEQARAFRIRQRGLDDDYDYLSMRARAKKAKGRELTPEEDKRYQEQAHQIADLETKLVEANERAETAQLQKKIDRVKRQTRRQETKAVLDDEFASLKAELAQAKLETRSGVQGSLLAGLDPEGKLTPIIAKMAKNRVKAGITDAAQLVDEIHAAISEHVEGLSKRDIRDVISGYGLEGKDRRSNAAKQLASIRSELKKLSAQEDIEAGKRLSPRDKTRQTQLTKQEAELTRRLTEKDFSEPVKKEPLPYTRETYSIQKRVNELKQRFDNEQYRARRGKTGLIIDTIAGFGNIPKTMLSMGDVSALLRQGGIGVYQHPILSAKAAVDMLKSFSEHGFANVENAIKSHPDFETLKRAGLEFTGVDKDSPQLSKREEGYLGSDVIDTLARGKLNPLRVVKGVKDVSERTFVSFLDSQRMRIGAAQLKALRGMKLSPKDLQDAIKSQAKYINIITGRGSLGEKGNQAAPVLNMAMFSPRLVASRVQMLNKMFNPVSWANTPKGARKLQMADNAKFLFGVASTLALAKAAGANVNLNPDDSEFLKIKVGDTRYDTLAGLQQPMRFLYRMSQAVKGGETYAGDSKSDILLDFARSKAAPGAGYGWDFVEGKNRLSGKKFEAGKDLVRNVIPLPLQDFQDAIKHDGAVRGIAKAFPSLLGVGVQTYKGSPEKPTTRAEKLTLKLLGDRMPDEGRTQEEIDRDQNIAELRAQARRGVDISKTLDALKQQGTITDKKAQSILSSRGQTRLQQGFRKLGLKEALTVYSTMNPNERQSVNAILGEKAQAVDLLPLDDQADVRKKLSDFGFKPGMNRPQVPKRPQRPEKPNPYAWQVSQ